MTLYISLLNNFPPKIKLIRHLSNWKNDFFDYRLVCFLLYFFPTLALAPPDDDDNNDDHQWLHLGCGLPRKMDAIFVTRPTDFCDRQLIRDTGVL